MKIAIIGTGISGMGAAYALHKDHDITVYEKADYIGGHSRTVDVQTPDGMRAVDTGFIVYNYQNYPYLSALFRELEVKVAESNMSFGVSVNNGWLEYSGENILGVFAQKRNLLRLNFLRFIADIISFNRRALSFVTAHPHTTVEECLCDMGLGEWFKDYYFLVIAGAIWSTSPTDINKFSAKSIVQFFANHGLLTVKNAERIQWYTVKGGSREYVRLLTENFRDRIRLSTGVVAVGREKNGVKIYDTKGGEAQYDQVIIATHSDQALALIKEPHPQEQDILSSITYQPNQAILHSDRSFMPKRKAAWASWVYLSRERKDKREKVMLSYWMNSLQPLNTKHPIILTLNATQLPASNLIHDIHEFRHPILDAKALQAQLRIEEIQGTDRIWFCGAWQGHGFHEDGLESGIHVAKRIATEM